MCAFNINPLTDQLPTVYVLVPLDAVTKRWGLLRFATPSSIAIIIIIIIIIIIRFPRSIETLVAFHSPSSVSYERLNLVNNIRIYLFI